jgi:hypothetical protein
MDIVIDAVKKLQDTLRHSGCDDGPVVLRVDPDVVPCQYEKGACMEAGFGGRTGEFVTFDPIRATTKIEFMFGAPLDTPATRGAACAVLNVVTAFLCLSRGVRACPMSCHTACRQELTARLRTTTRVYCIGSFPPAIQETGGFIVDNPDIADCILVNNEGLIAEGTGDLIEKYRENKMVLLLGPSTAGIASLERLERFCPYGT